MTEKIVFKNFCFDRDGDRLTLCGRPFIEIQVAGENRPSHLGAKSVCTSEGEKLRYISHSFQGESLRLRLNSDFVSVDMVLTSAENSRAVRIEETITNISDQPITLEAASSFVMNGIAGNTDDWKEVCFYRFVQGHHGECQPRKNSLARAGLDKVTFAGQYRIACANIGSWSTKEELPQGIIENNGTFTMFQIESNHSWYYEMGDAEHQVYLYLGGANETFGGWAKTLRPQQSYRPVACAICVGGSIEEVIGEMTKYRRSIAGKCEADKGLPVIFNEYMHLSWDSPCEENTRRYARAAAAAGADYYVIDCGWHDEAPGSEVYPYVGKWRESKCRFPSGLRKTTDHIRSLGMKACLWIEPEVIGYKNTEMLAYYGDECFLQRYGKKFACRADISSTSAEEKSGNIWRTRSRGW